MASENFDEKRDNLFILLAQLNTLRSFFEPAFTVDKYMKKNLRPEVIRDA